MSDVEDDPYANAVGGALKIKGIDFKRKKSSKKKKKKRKREEEEGGGDESAAAAAASSSTAGGGEEQEEPAEEDPADFMTDAERRYHKTMKQRASQAAQSAVTKTHREKVEDFNFLLDNLTEHNDIPRVSAAGNG